MNLSDLFTSLIRTLIPMVVGWLVAYLAGKSITIDETNVAMLTNALGLIAGFVYYAAARLLELKWPKLSWLLGSPKLPMYDSKQ